MFLHHRPASDAELAEELGWWANCIGATGAPFDSFLALRGLRTLQVRMRQHQETAGLLARELDEQETVRRVYYPGLETHPGHRIARQQQGGFGGMISFELAGDESAVATFLSSLRHFSLAESLGGVESLVCHPATMTHWALPAEERAAIGVTDGLVRLSVGLEDPDDIIEDLADRDGSKMHFEAAGLNLGQIEHGIDQTQQVLRTGLHFAQVIDLLLR